MKTGLSEKWTKAAVAGTIWAASEIVLGSFLHNLRIPFSGNFLTAIGLIVLISLSYKWSVRGLFWRAGLICAIMKTMSPSAVIFGPMIAIMAESFLLELSTRLLGRTYAGYIIGAMLAMSWNLFHKIASYIISYGSNIVEIYTSLLNMAERQLSIKTDLVWLPIIILLVLYALFGILSAVIGLRVGRKLLREPYMTGEQIKPAEGLKQTEKKESKFIYSLLWLLLDIVLIVGAFIVLNYTAWYIWATTVTLVIILWAVRYNNSLRRISKPKFWIFFVALTLLTAFVFVRIKPGDYSLADGLLTGIQMNFRAALIVVGFSVIGTELYNPVIREFFSKTMFKNLPVALEIAVESLPDFIASIPEFKILVRNPVSIFYGVISHADAKLDELRSKNNSDQKVYIVTGPRDSGKTTLVRDIVEILKVRNLPVAGFLAVKVINNSEFEGYDIVDIETDDAMPLMRIKEEKWKDKIGKFHISPDGFSMGERILNQSGLFAKKLVVIDEIGVLELDNKGWSGYLKKLTEMSGTSILITVRDAFMNDVLNKWDLHNAVIIHVNKADPQSIADKIIGAARFKNG